MKVIALVSVPPIAPPAVSEPRVDEAKSLVVEIVSLPVESSVAVRLLACSDVLSWSRVLTVPPVPSPKVTLTAAPPLKEEKVKVLPDRLPAAAERPAENVVAVPVLPVRPSDDSALPVPMMERSDTEPVEICNAPLAPIEDLVAPAAVLRVAAPLAFAVGLDTGGEVDGIEHVGNGTYSPGKPSSCRCRR